MKTILVLTMTAFVAACATKQPPPKISYDPEDFDAAALTMEPPRPVEIVTVPEPLPLPGQLKRLPGDQARTEDHRPPEIQPLVTGGGHVADKKVGPDEPGHDVARANDADAR